MQELTERYPLLKEITFQNLSGLITTAAIALPSLYSYFSSTHEYRWIALGLYFMIFFFIAVRAFALEANPLQAGIYIAFQTVLVTSLIALPPHHEYIIILFFVLSAEATTLLPGRYGYYWIAVFALITSATLVLLAGLQTALYSAPIYIGGFLFFGVFASSAAKAEAARKESQTLLQDLREAHQKLQAYTAQAEELAVSEERNRLSREMHDTLGHRLTVAIVQLEGAKRLIKENPDKAEQIVGTVHEQMRAALSELRSTVATLREPLQSDISLKSALRALGENFQAATEIQVEMAFAYKLPDFPDEYRVALYRAAQEALTNVQRHAKADKVRMTLEIQSGEINLTLYDNGIGLPDNADKLGFGLRGIKERAAQLGGRMCLEPNPEGGAQICICLPLP